MPWRAHGEGVQPQRDLGELHGHRILVHAVDAALQHHAADDVAVVELPRVHGPAVGRGVVQNRPANVGDAARQRRDVTLYRGVGRGNRGDHAVAQQIDQADQKVAGAHGRVADLQVE